MTLIDALECLAEHASVKHATLCIRLTTDAAVDELYRELGPTCDDAGKRIAKESCPPDWATTEEGHAYWREAVTTVAGVRVILSGPMRVGRRAA